MFHFTHIGNQKYFLSFYVRGGERKIYPLSHFTDPWGEVYNVNFFRFRMLRTPGGRSITFILSDERVRNRLITHKQIKTVKRA